MTDDPNPLIKQLQRASRRWRVATILAFSGLFLVVLIQTVFIIDLRDQLENTHESAEWAQKAATAAQDDAREARRILESAREVQAEKHVRVVQLDDRPMFLFPTDQLDRDFDVPNRR